MITLKQVKILCFVILLASCGSSDSSGSTSPAASISTFDGNIVLGSPEGTSIKIKLYSADQNGTVLVKYGTVPGVYTGQTAPAVLTAGNPVLFTVDGLSSDTGYYYELCEMLTDGTVSAISREYSFHTARPSGSSFVFTVQADSHMDENSIPEQYYRTLSNVLSDLPDFHIDMGDTFMCEKHSVPLSAVVLAAPDYATVDTRYAYEMGNFGRVTHSTPLFLVNGNHEGELGWLNDGTSKNLAVWSVLARLKYFPGPFLDSFYGGDTVSEPNAGQRASWYSWSWGDALFIVLDPFWNSKTQASQNGWNITLGDRQYAWLKSTLSSSTAKFKFVFIHNLTGGLDGQMRGGIEAAPYYEWGGKNADGTDGFAANRPNMSMPIHKLLVANGVSAVFHGHDHIYARQTLDGILYMEVPQPSAKNFSNGATLAAEYHYAAGTILSSSGHVRATVAPSAVKIEYVRSWLSQNETAQRKNAQVDDTFTITAK